MHTSRALSSGDFEICADGRPATVDDLLPGFDEHSRLGIVVTQAGGGAGASTLILAAVTAFYDRLRATWADFFAYADYFAFHVGRPRGSLRKLDVFPEHKEPVVADDAEAILEAINDRGVRPRTSSARCSATAPGMWSGQTGARGRPTAASRSTCWKPWKPDRPHPRSNIGIEAFPNSVCT